MPHSIKDVDSIVLRFVSAALQHPAIPLAEVKKRIESPRTVVARGRVNHFVRSHPEARTMARGAEGLARVFASTIVASRSGVRSPGADDLGEEDMIEAILPLVYAVIARDLGESDSAIRPLLDLARRVAPRVRL